MEASLLTINGGSSSIKFAVYARATLSRTLHGSIERVGLSGSSLAFTDTSGNVQTDLVSVPNMEEAIICLKKFLDVHVDMNQVTAIGHRVVHGMNEESHRVITPELIATLKQISPVDPEHMPSEIALIEMFAAEYPSIAQVACFDTVFHHDMPRVAQLLAFPRRFEAKGMRRYGFHGLSCAYLMKELARIDLERANGRVIIAHLGNGASITAVHEGKSVDTTMGFTPSGGIPMSSRAGDVDPGALLYLAESEGLSTAALTHMVNHEAGLLGVSETTSDMYDLLQSEATDVRAHEAVDLFCYEAKKRIGAYAAALGGVDTLIFSGGMGEHAPRIRDRICSGLGFLGIELLPKANQSNENLISTPTAPVSVRVIHTDEEAMIAHITHHMI